MAIIFNGRNPVSVYFNDEELNGIIYNGSQIWTKSSTSLWHEMWIGWLLLIDEEAMRFGNGNSCGYIHESLDLPDNVPTRVNGSVVDVMPACGWGSTSDLEWLNQTELPYISEHLDDADATYHLYQGGGGLYGFYNKSWMESGEPSWGRGFCIETIEQQY